MDKDASDPVVGIVRSFSDEASALDPDDTLTNALAVKVADDRSDERQSAFPQPEWQRLFYDAASFACVCYILDLNMGSSDGSLARMIATNRSY